MNVFLWVLQIALALHTIMGAVWKVANSEQAVPSLGAIPHAGWMGLVALEVICAAGLIAPAVGKSFAMLAPIAALVIAAEMVLFCVVNMRSSVPSSGQMTYWLVVAAVCVVIAWGRLAHRPV
jgi:hypothetical protein